MARAKPATHIWPAINDEWGVAEFHRRRKIAVIHAEHDTLVVLNQVPLAIEVDLRNRVASRVCGRVGKHEHDAGWNTSDLA